MKVLFVCKYNSARSQMAAAFFNHYALKPNLAESAGIEPGALSMHAVKAMAEKDIDIFGNVVKSVDDAGSDFTHLVVIGDETITAKCPSFPKLEETVIWDLPDPSTFDGSQEEFSVLLCCIRDTIEQKVKALVTDGLE
ncbi:MAG: arsenate reductase ArsC [Campylobacterota bacterium]|nr:arsenate reductase ArsC [Campylobacterota bacterium]